MLFAPLPFILISLAGAVILDLLLGEPPTRFHPVGLMGRFIASGVGAGRNAGRAGRNAIRAADGAGRSSSDVTSFFRGMAIILSGLVVFALPPLLVVLFDIPFWWIWTIPLVKSTFAVRSLFSSAAQVQRSLEAGDLSEARRLVGYHLVSRSTENLSVQETASAVVESVAENITDSIISPVFFYLIAGLPGAAAYRFINTADAMIAYRTPEYEWLGKFTAWCDTVLNFIPARLAGVSIVLGTAMAGRDWRRAFGTMRSQHGRTASPNAGWTMAAMAGALGVTLEKKEHYRLEGGSSPCVAENIGACRKICARALIAALVFLAALSAAAGTLTVGMLAA